MDSESDLNCCQLCAKKLCCRYSVCLTQNEYDMLSGFGDGLGAGGLCGAVIGAIAGACLIAGGVEAEKIRLSVIMEFMDTFSTVSCSKLSDYYSNGCERVIATAVAAAENALKVTGLP
ncbi:C-GCAxxG-C-C family protein [Lachnospiraceae bacterium NSJ-143]|nr:C-GCAxxG-C-C family protein [Lachnospiraceae bacterium NSJ-143]